MASSKLRNYIDIGANLTDLMYTGVYHGTRNHFDDLQHVMNRSWDAGLSKIIITGGNLEDSKKALEMAQTDERLYSTVGCHPTRCDEFESEGTDPKTYLKNLKKLAQSGKSKVVAIGECGLDYDRLQFCSKETQMKYFNLQLSLSTYVDLPLFLHCRNAAEDMIVILKNYNNLRGVVHSYDGRYDRALWFIQQGFYIGINGCSLKTEENLQTVKKLPSDKILLETDCPWCEIRPSHAGYKYVKEESRRPSIDKRRWKAECMVKGRNEPANICQVLDIIAGVKGEDPDELAKIFFQNSQSLFFPNENTGN